MTKKEFIREYAKKLGVSQKDAEKALNYFLETIELGLITSEKVSFVGWGSFSLVMREERDGRNPQTGALIRIPAKRVVKFKPGTLLEKEVSSAKKAKTAGKR